MPLRVYTLLVGVEKLCPNILLTIIFRRVNLIQEYYYDYHFKTIGKTKILGDVLVYVDQSKNICIKISIFLPWEIQNISEK